MVTKELNDWINKEKSEGFSDEQIKQTLLNQGYTQKNIDESLNSTKIKEETTTNFDDFLIKKSKFFRFLVYNALNLLTLIILIPFGVLMLVNAFINLKIHIYIFLMIYSIISGYLIFFIYSVLTNKFEKILYYGIKSSLILAIMFSINAIFYYIFNNLTQQFNQQSEENLAGASAMLNIFSSDLFNPYIGFALAIILFNIPFFIYYIKNNVNKNKLLWYFLPIFIFIIFTVICIFLILPVFTSKML